jgi:ABC-type sugar transport system ATPase subunit
MSYQIDSQTKTVCGGGEIRLENVSVAIKPLSLVVPDGVLLLPSWPSGCGKTTLLRMLTGHETPTEGKFTIGDRQVTSLPPSARTAMKWWW